VTGVQTCALPIFEAAQIILLLVSIDFINSKYCYDH